MVNTEKDKNAEEQILAAAKKIFIQKGLAGARMQDIADEAKINKAMLHYYFRSKEKLFDRIFDEALGRFLPVIQPVFLLDIPLFEKIERFVSEYIDMLSANPHLPLFILHEITQDPERLIKKIMIHRGESLPAKFILQVQAEAAAGKIRKVSPVQFFINMLSLTIFPFAAKPLLQLFLEMDEVQFQTMVQNRKKEVTALLIGLLKVVD